MYLECGRVRVRIGFLFAAYLVFLICTQSGVDRWFLLCSAAAHELAHLLILLRCGVPRITVELLPGGAAIRDASAAYLSYRQSFAAAVAGPAVNLLGSAAFFLCARRWGGEAFRTLAWINLLLGGINLLPLSFLDGGAALFSLLSLLRRDPAPPELAAADLLTLLFLTVGCVWLLCTGRPAFYAVAFTGYCILYCFRKKQ